MLENIIIEALCAISILAEMDDDTTDLDNALALCTVDEPATGPHVVLADVLAALPG